MMEAHLLVHSPGSGLVLYDAATEPVVVLSLPIEPRAFAADGDDLLVGIDDQGERLCRVAQLLTSGTGWGDAACIDTPRPAGQVVPWEGTQVVPQLEASGAGVVVLVESIEVGANLDDNTVSIEVSGEPKLAVGDVDGDGSDELVIRDELGPPLSGTGRVRVFSRSEPDTPLATLQASGDPTFGNRLTLADLDGDDAAELVASGRSGVGTSLFVFDGELAGEVDPNESLVWDVSTSANATLPLAVLDADGDGVDDLAVSTSSWSGGRVWVSLGGQL